jgi:hypothetical protein
MEKGIRGKETNNLYYDVLENRESPRRGCTEKEKEEGEI